MAGKYSREQLNKLEHEFLVEMFLNQQEQLAQLTEEIHSMSAELKKLSDQLVSANRYRYGRSTEKMTDTEQISFRFEEDGNVALFNEAESIADLSIPEPETLEFKPKRRKKRTGKKQEDLSDLPTEIIPHYLSEEELTGEFGENGWNQLPDAIIRHYLFVPAEVKVEEHHIGVYSSKKDSHMVKAPHPKSLLRGSLVSPSIGAAIINGKYVNALPINRISEEFKRKGLNISRQNMANWMIRLAEEYFAILYDHLHQKLYEFPVIQADETPVLVNKDGRRAGTKSYMWVYRSGYMYTDRQIILYEYQKTRNASHPREFLKDYTGVCVTDGYQVYHTLEKEKEDLTIAGCWVHMRRRWEDALNTYDKKVQKETACYRLMKQIQAIYREEGKLKGLSSEERLKERQCIIQPMVDAFFAYLKQNQRNFSKTGKIQDAVKYSLNQEKYLRVFLENGDVPIDNNASERAIRGFTIGRKNWQTIDTINGAKSSAILYSIAETAKANDLKLYDYFKYLLEEIPKHTEDTDRTFLDNLVPWSMELPEELRKPKI